MRCSYCIVMICNFLINGQPGTKQTNANAQEVMQSCQALLYSIVCGLLIFLCKPTHAHAQWRWAQIPHWFMGGAGGGVSAQEGELWCVNGCSRLSHPGLFFSSLTQQSISSLLEGLVLDSSWHVPPSLRARDEGARCAECSNIAHTHPLLLGEKENWKERIKVREGDV